MKNIFKTFVIMILAAAVISFTETRTVTGRVSDDQGNPLPGVLVKVKGSVTGTITDLRGNYKIT
ncbi:MAG TPA: carboxypeptidase-like regulatory domain-containing protein, partial [Bacteroidales bacterium]|nr:carboxypeptidase-like regulatory domain-containing protein [Bacteroidales bacterium]